jgi:sulfoxide reductase heme-binding subunit YedZ
MSLWYLGRATGVCAIVLLTLSLALGVVVNRKVRIPGLSGFAVAAIHRNISLLVVAFLGVHIASNIIDPYASVRWADAVIPFISSYRPLWLGLGAFAFDLLIAVVVTSLVRARIGPRTWKAVHWAAYALWPIAFVHGLFAADDLRSGLLLVVDATCVLIVAAAVAFRFRHSARVIPRHKRAQFLLADERERLVAEPAPAQHPSP